MQLVHSHKTSSYTFVLTEDEWYSGTEQQREAWVNQIMIEGAKEKCNNLNILVKPDTIMSVSPIAHTHSVYCHIVRSNKIVAGSNEWWIARRVANGDARRPWYELTDEDREALK